jgi:hypothetical protein
MRVCSVVYEFIIMVGSSAGGGMTDRRRFTDDHAMIHSPIAHLDHGMCFPVRNSTMWIMNVPNVAIN